MTIAFTYYRAGHPIQNFLNRRRFRRVLLQCTARAGVDGWTLIHTVGAWQGNTEPSFLLEIEGITHTTGRKLAKILRETFQQQAVMLKTERGAEFI